MNDPYIGEYYRKQARKRANDKRRRLRRIKRKIWWRNFYSELVAWFRPQ